MPITLGAATASPAVVAPGGGPAGTSQLAVAVTDPDSTVHVTFASSAGKSSATVTVHPADVNSVDPNDLDPATGLATSPHKIVCTVDRTDLATVAAGATAGQFTLTTV
jgi:hypothetical protein